MLSHKKNIVYQNIGTRYLTNPQAKPDSMNKKVLTIVAGHACPLPMTVTGRKEEGKKYANNSLSG